MKEWSRINKTKLQISFSDQTALRRSQVSTLSRVPADSISFQSHASVPDEGFTIRALGPTTINIAVPVGLSHAIVEQRQRNMMERKRVAEHRRKKEEAARRTRQAAREEQREEERRIRQEQKRSFSFDLSLSPCLPVPELKRLRSKHSFSVVNKKLKRSRRRSLPRLLVANSLQKGKITKKSRQPPRPPVELDQN
jgi:hypothetical protein